VAIRLETEVIVIGGGATGAGVLRDLAIRGIKALLVEQKDLTNGTSARYHGLLHSGARYAVSDQEAAIEIYRENLLIKKTIPGSVEETGGLFVKLPQDDDQYLETWINACQAIGIPLEKVTVSDALQEEPLINKAAQAVYRVPDGAVDGFTMVIDLVADAVNRGAKVLTYHQVIQLIIRENKAIGVKARNNYTGETTEIYADLIVNASGPWAAKVAELAGIHLEMINHKGLLTVFSHRFNKQVINRLRMPSDADIFVPAHNVTIFGTTEENVIEPDDLSIDRDELAAMLQEGSALIPELQSIRILRAFSGVRPLYQRKNRLEKSGRNISREMALLDHQESDGIAGIITITGGKLTTFRYMAEKTVDLVCTRLGISAACSTMTEVVPHRLVKDFFVEVNLAPAAKNKLLHWAGGNSQTIENNLKAEGILNTIVCECEQVTLGEIEAALPESRFSLGDIRRRTRLGMGPCQGTFCTHRTAAFAVARGKAPVEEAEEAVKKALEERQKGMNVLAIGESAKQLELMEAIYHISLGLRREKPPNV